MHTKTQYFAVDKVNGTIYTTKDGQWEPQRKSLTIDGRNPSHPHIYYPISSKQNG